MKEQTCSIITNPTTQVILLKIVNISEIESEPKVKDKEDLRLENLSIDSKRQEKYKIIDEDKPLKQSTKIEKPIRNELTKNNMTIRLEVNYQ
jgi:hypothetical protein